MMKNVTICILLVIATLMAAGCGKIHTCYCNYDNSYIDIIDTALYDSITILVDDFPEPARESALECSYWNYHDTVGQYLPEYGIRRHTVLECREQGK